MAAERAEVTPELAREAGDLRVRMSRLARRLRQEDRGHALTMSQLTALSRLDRLDATTLSELASGERVRPQSMARTVDALEAAGLAGRTPHPADRRQNVISLTDAGRTVIAENRFRRDTWLARAMASVLSPEERDLLVRAGALMDLLAEFTEKEFTEKEEHPPASVRVSATGTDSAGSASPAGPLGPAGSGGVWMGL